MPACLRVWKGGVRHNSKCLIVDKVLFWLQGAVKVVHFRCSLVRSPFSPAALRGHQALLFADSKLRLCFFILLRV